MYDVWKFAIKSVAALVAVILSGFTSWSTKVDTTHSYVLFFFRASSVDLLIIIIVVLYIIRLIYTVSLTVLVVHSSSRLVYTS